MKNQVDGHQTIKELHIFCWVFQLDPTHPLNFGVAMGEIGNIWINVIPKRYTADVRIPRI